MVKRIGIVVLLGGMVAIAREPIVLPVAKGRPVGVTVSTTQTSAGNVTRAVGFVDKRQWIAFDVDSPGGLYRAAIRYRTPDEKGFELRVAGLAYGGFFPASTQFADHDAGVVELPAGKSEVTIGGGWGHYEISDLTLRPAVADAPPPKPSTTLVTHNASPEARDLFRKLIAAYGRYTFSGVQTFDDLDYVKQKAGHDVAMLNRDLIEYTPSRVERGSKPDGMTERVIAEAKAGRTVSLCWHWNAPTGLIDKIEVDADGKKVDKSWYRGFYTNSTTFDFAKALDDPNGADYKLLLRDIDAIAVQLAKLRDAHVPVLWRPLHEAEGGWFWWGARGPTNYVRLYRLLFDRLTKVHHLDNLIWVYTSGGKPDWYPGDDVVDVIGADAYPDDNRDPLTGIWNTLRKSFGDRKLLTLSEVGFVPDIERMQRHGVYWSYFAPWTDKLGPRGMKDEELKSRLASPGVRGRGAS